jgi:hypothetical protein
MSWTLNRKVGIANINIKNEGTDIILMPLNKSSLQAYSSDNCIMNGATFDKFQFYFSPTVIVNNDSDKIQVETFSSTPYIDISKFDRLKSKSDSINERYNDKIYKGKKKNEIDSLNDAQVNFYLINHLLTLKPKEEISISLPFNLINISVKDNGIYDSYVLDQNKIYSAYLSICVDKNIYKYLTKKQKNRFKNITFFSGTLESNKIVIQ